MHNDTTVHADPPTPAAGNSNGLATTSMVLGLAAFLPIPGPAAGLAAMVTGLLSGRAGPGDTRHRHATIGITLGAVSVALFLTICFVYFVVLGYPLPHIGRYHPPTHHDQDCVC